MRAIYNRRSVLFLLPHEATSMRLTISVIVMTLLPASWALALTSTTVSFQNGVNGYSSTFDHYIYQNPGGGVDGSLTPDFILFGADATNSNAQQALIRFDSIFGSNPGQIPLGAKILDASLQLSTIGGLASSTDNTNGPYAVAGLTAPFDSTTTFGSYAAGHGAWYEDGATTRPLGSYGRLDVGETQKADIRSVVQQWSDGTLANNGLAVTGGFPGTATDSWRILTTSNTSPGSRPKLNVTYTTDNVAVNSFQRGTNSYTNVDSERVTSKCNTNGVGCTAGSATTVNTDGNTLGSMTLQLADAASSEQFATFRFNDVFGTNAGQAPTDKPVQKAWLVLTTLNSSNVNARIPAPVDAYELSTSWDQTRTFDQYGANGGLQSGDGDITQNTLYRTPSVTNDGEIWFDVTDYAERIRNGATNNGIAIQARSTDGWQFAMNGSSAANIATRPRLVVMSDLTAVGGSLAGDFNNDSKVDAADYVYLRKTGAPQSSYDTWRANFGNTGSGAAAPRPTTVLKYDPSAKNGVLTGAINNGTTALANLPAAPTPTGVTSLALVRGAGLANSGLTNGFAASSWTVGGDAATAVANNDYYEWGFTLDAAHKASLSALDLWAYRNLADAPTNFEVQVSLDNFATAGTVVSDFTYKGHVDGDTPAPDPSLDTPFYYMANDLAGRPNTTFSPSDPLSEINLSTVAALQNIPAGKTVRFRIYGWGANADAATFGFRMIGPQVTGIVSAISGLGSGAAVPEPGTLLLAAICTTFLTAIRRRRNCA
jgi:hypothetical protein